MSTNFTVSTGRGGAGNMLTTSESPTPKLVPSGSQTPVLLQAVYSTGRGGAGNMRQNIDPQLTRMAQDVDDDIDVRVDHLSENDNELNKIHSMATSHGRPKTPPQTLVIGRGGAGNILESKKSNERHKKRNESGSLFKKFKLKISRLFC
ncbi:HCL553Cp [Eremothecium sinecaudum]|uniref:HCL553Cp n=1 Tax=Eremothecium sinecaudum TaxID=45286 RepID=A0A109UY47_9SACH|nr:HCL553Cp [Eremothecium sinecaudum]AMD19598.1 HCL553Cp [Eremothecium sinecaudum]